MTEGLIDTRSITDPKQGVISIVGTFASGAPTWPYSVNVHRSQAISDASSWLVKHANNWSGALEQSHPTSRAIFDFIEEHEYGTDDKIRDALTALSDPMALIRSDDGSGHVADSPSHLLHLIVRSQVLVKDELFKDERIRLNVDQPDLFGRSALAYVVLSPYGIGFNAYRLCANGADPNQPLRLGPNVHHEAEGTSLLEFALNEGRSTVARALFAAGARPEDAHPADPLQAGARCGYAPWITQGLADGTDPAMAFDAAISAGQLDGVRAFLDAGCRPSDMEVPSGPSCIHAALLTAHKWALDEEQKFWMNHASQEAHRRDRIGIVRLLVAAGANACAVDANTGDGVFDAFVRWPWSQDDAMELAFLLHAAGAIPTVSVLSKAVAFGENPQNVAALLAVGAPRDEVDPNLDNISPAAYVRARSDREPFASLQTVFDRHALLTVVGDNPKPRPIRRRGGL